MHYIGTKAPLEASGGDDTYTSNWILTNNSDRLTGSVFSDQAGTFTIEQSGDGVEVDVATDISITANDGKGFSEEILLPWLRIKMQNTAGDDQTTLRIYTRMANAGARE